MTWTQEQHDAARARCEAATAGPWAEFDGDFLFGDDDDPVHAIGVVGSDKTVLLSTNYDLEPRAEDVVFCAAAALDEIERLRAQLNTGKQFIGSVMPEEETH